MHKGARKKMHGGGAMENPHKERKGPPNGKKESPIKKNEPPNIDNLIPGGRVSMSA